MVNEGILAVGLFLLLVILRVPLFISLATPPIIYVLLHRTPIVIIAQKMAGSLNSFTILTIPLFIFVGSLMNNSGITDKIFDFSVDLIGHFNGGLAYVNIFSSLIFSGMSGSALADIGGIGKVLIDAMDKNGYNKDYSAALTCSAATVGPIFPPSVPIIIYGIISETPILSLLIAGIIPALLIVVVLAIATFAIAQLRGFPTGEKSSTIEIWHSFKEAVPALIAPVILIGSLLQGYFGPTEAAAATIGYILLINGTIYRQNVEYIWRSSVESVQTTSIIMITIAAASLFAWVITVERTTLIVSGALLAISTDPLIVLLLINIMLIVLGLFLEPISAMLLSIPLVLPVATDIGVDPVHLGVIMVLNLMIGLLTPPLGLSLFIASDVSGVDVGDIIRQMGPYYLSLVILLLIITYFPELSLYLPQTFL